MIIFDADEMCVRFSRLIAPGKQDRARICFDGEKKRRPGGRLKINYSYCYF